MEFEPGYEIPGRALPEFRNATTTANKRIIQYPVYGRPDRAQKNLSGLGGGYSYLLYVLIRHNRSMKNKYTLKCYYFIGGQCTNTLIEPMFVVDGSIKSENFCRTCSYRPQSMMA